MRAAGAADRPFLEALYAEKRAAEVRAWGLSDAQAAGLLAMQYAAFRHSLAARPRAREWVLTEAGDERGYLAVDELDAELRIVELQVASAYRRRGIARRALEAVLAEADRRQLAVSLHVDHGNPALKLYELLGFVAQGTDLVGSTLRRQPRP